MEISVVYSIGVRCDTEMILKRLDLIKFSSIFGSMNIRNYENLIKCFNSNFQILFDPDNLVYSKYNPKWMNENKKYGLRTLNKMFDDITNYHSATIAHHDLSSEKDMLHFIRGIHRLNYIRKNNIPILFVNISIMAISPMEFDNTNYNPLLIESIKNSGFNNMKLLSIYKDSSITKTEMMHICDNHIIYKIPNCGDLIDDIKIKEILLTHFKFTNLLCINDFTN